MTAPLAIEIADYLAQPLVNAYLTRGGRDELVDVAQAILTIIDNAAPPPTDDITLGLRTLRALREFAETFANDPLNDDEDCWAGSAADHAEQLYNILTTAGLKP